MCSDIDNDWKALESAASMMLASCETEDREMIDGHLAPLGTELAEVKETVEHKAAACELLVEHLEVRREAEERLADVEERLKDDCLTVDEMEQSRLDLGESRSRLMQLESGHLEMEAVMADAGVVVKDHKTEMVVDMRADVEKLISCVEKDDKKLKVCEEIVAINAHVEETASELRELKEVYTDDMQSLASSDQVLNYIFMLLC